MTDAWAMAEEMAEAQKAEAGVFQKWEADGEAHVMVLCVVRIARACITLRVSLNA